MERKFENRELSMDTLDDVNGGFFFCKPIIVCKPVYNPCKPSYNPCKPSKPSYNPCKPSKPGWGWC